MEATNSDLISYLQLHTLWIIFKHAFLGVFFFGLLVGALYFINYLVKIYKLPRTSRQYKHQSEHFQKQTLIRYIITIGCMLTMTGLFYFFIEIGKASTHIGAALWLIWYIIRTVKLNNKIKKGEQKSQI